eukprot:gene14039-4120_t
MDMSERGSDSVSDSSVLKHVEEIEMGRSWSPRPIASRGTEIVKAPPPSDAPLVAEAPLDLTPVVDYISPERERTSSTSPVLEGSSPASPVLDRTSPVSPLLEMLERTSISPVLERKGTIVDPRSPDFVPKSPEPSEGNSVRSSNA